MRIHKQTVRMHFTSSSICFWSFIDIIKKQKLIRYKILEKIIRLGRD